MLPSFSPTPLARRRWIAAAVTFLIAAPAVPAVEAPQSAPAGILAAAVARPGRPEGDRKRDADRKPAAVLAFLGIEPGMHVVDAMAANGYYTEILAHALGSGGMVYAHNSPRTDGFFGEALRARVGGLDTGNVELLVAEVEEPGFPRGVDAVLLIRFYHDFCWFGSDRGAFNRAVFEALKPGGVFGIIDHRALPEAGCSVGQSLHRIEEKMVREEILAAGFVLEAESDLLANPDDAHDWSIFVDRGEKRDRTDRFVIRFRKPAP